MYLVIITSFDDNYKRVQPPDNVYYLFNDKKNAEIQLHKSIVKEILYNINERDITIPKSFKKYFNFIKTDDYETIEIKTKYENDINVLEKIHNELMEGEFIKTLFSWEIREIDVIDK